MQVRKGCLGRVTEFETHGHTWKYANMQKWIVGASGPL